MLGTHVSALLGAESAGAVEALELVDGFDATLVHGLARLDAERAGAVTALAGAFAASPLGERVAEAAAKVTAGAVAEDALIALAGARTALLGAVHDDLIATLDAAIGRERAAWAGENGKAGEADNLLSGCRAWLAELAIAGWRGVESDLVSGGSQAVEALYAKPDRRGLAVLLDGLAAELTAGSPLSTMAPLPSRRWADLWARGMMLSAADSLPGEPEEVSGRLLVLGLELQEHATVVRAQIHGVLETAAGKRLVRTGVAAGKTDTIVGPQVWSLLAGFPVLLGAVAEKKALELTGMTLLPGGDLVWDEEKAKPGEAVDPFATARLQLGEAVAPSAAPLERHPVRIAEPVFLQGYGHAAGAFVIDGHELPVALDRLPTAGPLTAALVASSTECVGLLRWDGRWFLQPLAVRATVKKATVDVHIGDWAMGPTDPKVAKALAKADAVAVLRERAGRLLRK
ncbi:hypothetical protein Afil01_62460 [Actinorhabdospora filicis]|uniref:Uncharacterized protein n=1 Tax=Actinorhabdospora filicis TaxID=1785913 RepID=A0A9W6WCA1_9ACTN|nr:hypothetical protein [Actinorhabdospora filicis]GLZ81439.1 hypothetical protein Afil01_62460 [Actinorhabdospora filicis]